MRIIILVGLGSFLGGIFRYLLTQYVQTRVLSEFPLGTLLVNITGSFLIGIVFGLAGKFSIGPEWRFFLMTGVIGGFTTFSSYSLEIVNLMRGNQPALAMLYLTGSILLSVPFTFLGLFLSR